MDQDILVFVVCRKSFRFRVYPTIEQRATLARWQDALRFLWNLALEQRLIALGHPRCDRKYLTAFDQHKQLTELRAELPWLAEVPRNVCAQLLVELDKAWQRCFAKIAKQPRWKRKGRDLAPLCEPHPKVWSLDVEGLHFPKLGTIRIVKHRCLEGMPKTCSLVQEVDQWFVSISCKVEQKVSPKVTPVVALDRGCVNLVADSDGRLIKNPHFLRVMGLRIARAQRVVSRRKKGSRNREKAKIRRVCTSQHQPICRNVVSRTHILVAL